MIYRWLHKSWKYFWGIILSVLLTVIILAGGLIGILQFDMTQKYISDRIERQVEQSYNADLSIGGLDGFLPFKLSMNDVTLSRSDSSAVDTLATIKQINSQIDIWGLLQNKVSITGFSVTQPRVWLESDEKGKIIFLERSARPARDSLQTQRQGWLTNVEVVAPAMEITDGAVFLSSLTKQTQIGGLPQSFSVTNINANFFLDWSEQQRYLDIETFTATANNLNVSDISLSGQLYSDQRYVEFNSFYVTLGNSQFVLNGEIEGANLLEPNFTDQLLYASYDLGLNSEQLYLGDFKDFVPNVPSVDQALSVELQAEGTLDSLWVDRAAIGVGESIFNMNGLLKKIRSSDPFSYEVRADYVNVRQQDIVKLFGPMPDPQYRALENLTVSGKANGTLDSVSVDLELSSPLGGLTMKGYTQLRSPYQYKGEMYGQNVDISSFFNAPFDTTALNFSAKIAGAGITVNDAETEFTANFSNSSVGDISFDYLTLKSSLNNGYWEQQYAYSNGDELIRGSGWADFRQADTKVSMQGNAQNVDLAKLFDSWGIASSKLNFDYNVELQGLSPNRLQGRANLDVKQSVIGQDTVRAHQFYMDLNAPDEQTRSFRLTSSLFDLNVSGQADIEDIVGQSEFWARYLRQRFEQEVLLQSPANSQPVFSEPPSDNIVLKGNMRSRDLSLIRKYIPTFPTIETDSRINFNVNTDGTRLLVSAEMQADSLLYDELVFRNSSTQLTASFRSNSTLKEFSSVDFQTNIGALQTPQVDLDSMRVDLSVKQDSVYLRQHVGQVSNNAQFDLALRSSIGDTLVAVSVQDFYLGNQEYAWVNQGRPSIKYLEGGKIAFEDFSFQNQKEYFRMQGVLSKNRADSLSYTLRDINLDRISALIKGDVEFAGILNGTLLTRSLTRQPTIQGKLNVNRFVLNDRMVGDVEFESKYNPDKNRFDTQIAIQTDSVKYDSYLDSNDGIGQNIVLDGYFLTPDPDVQQDSVYYFDADFRQIDMWVIPLIVKNIFSDMEGQATGEGHITGNMDDFDFHADFQTKNVFAKPRFVNSNYFINGHVALDRDDGVILDSLEVMDTKGGTGRVWGTVDLNDFKPITYLDLSIAMNRLQFLNNEFDPEVPFYGNVSGTGVIRLTGSNTDLYMRTENPVQLTSNSEVSIPLLEETELNQSGKFIEFVDSFDNINKKGSVNGNISQQQLNQAQIEEAIESMTFSERFDLDLQFDAPNNLTVNLIFDPVTGEIITSQGSGQLRITMQDQDVQMFGRYNITGGSYQFVTGEIISRRLELEPGGTIIWEGPPDNARLDISAIYRARPNVATLISEGAIDPQSQNGGSQQVPIELIVEINGTLNSVENNYYFQLPSSIDLSSNSTLQYTINQINRDEQQKLLQVVSIFITGQFIPTEGAGSATAGLSQNLRGSSVLNPLLSNQVISPLLSNQINALLNSDVSRLDVDFNLNAYNEVDLGIALRLYNDRLIFRREGQITGGGPQSSLGDRIGDLNATYRIRRGLSITAFHRQDQILSNLGATSSQTGDVTPNVDGIGLEARLQFNTWKGLLHRVEGTFNSIFGVKDKNKKQNNNEATLTEQEAKEEEN